MKKKKIEIYKLTILNQIPRILSFTKEKVKNINFFLKNVDFTKIYLIMSNFNFYIYINIYI